jgi:hypothetical protein
MPFVHHTAAFVEEATPLPIDDDPVRIHQHDRRGILAAGIDRLDMHAVPVAGSAGALLDGDADAVPGVETRARRNQFEGFRLRSEMRAHHRGVALKSAARENHGVSLERCRSAIAGLRLHATDAMTFHHQPIQHSFVADLHPCPLRRGGKLFDDGAAATDRLDTGRTGTEIIDGRNEFDAVSLEPSDCRHRMLRQHAEIISIGQSI